MEVATTIRLTAKEERFVSGLSYDLAPSRAAKVAGWTVGSTSRLLHEPHIRAALLPIHENTRQIPHTLANREKSFDEVEAGA